MRHAQQPRARDQEVPRVVEDLEADQVEGEHAAQQLVAHGQGLDHVRARPRDVDEDAESSAKTKSSTGDSSTEL